jgi:hypothetical protein
MILLRQDIPGCLDSLTQTNDGDMNCCNGNTPGTSNSPAAQPISSRKMYVPSRINSRMLHSFDSSFRYYYCDELLEHFS